MNSTSPAAPSLLASSGGISSTATAAATDEALFKAVKAGDRDQCVRLLESNKDNRDYVRERRGDNNNTPLIEAVKEGHFDIVELFIEYGAAIHDKDNSGNSPIICASEQGHVCSFIGKQQR